MAKQINARLMLKHDSLTNWNESPLVLKPGEVGVAYVDVATKDTKGNIIHVPTALLKVGENVENSTKTFKELPFVSALAADVYAWAKKEGIEILTDEANASGEIISNIAWDATKNALIVSRTDVVTPAELTTALANYYTKSEIDSLIAGYYTKGEIDSLIGDLDVGAIEGRVDAVETAVETTLPGLINNVDAKFAGYTKTENLDTTIDGFGYLKADDIAGKADKTELPKDLGDLTNNAGYAKTADVNKTLEDYAKTTDLPTKVSELENDVPYLVAADIAGKADSTKVAEDIATAIAPLATTAALNEYKEAHKDDYTNKQIDDAIAVVSGDLVNYYTKTEADAEFATPTEVIDAVNEALAKVSDADSITNITTLVEYVNENAGDLTALITEVYGAAEMTGDSRIDAAKADAAQAKADAATAVGTANSANATAGEAKELAESAVTTAGEAKTAAIDAQNSATASAAAAKASENNAKASEEAAAGSAADALAAQGAAETAKGAAETAQGLAETAKAGAEAAKSAAETAQGKAEAAQVAAEAAQAAAENSNTSATAIANQAKTTAENAASVAGEAKTAADKATEDVATLTEKVENLTTDDIDGGSEVWVFNCGTASTVI